MLRRILRRLFRICAGRLVEVAGQELQVMLLRHVGAVADPRAHGMDGMIRGEFRLPAAPQVLEELGPGLEPRLDDDALKLRPQVGAAVPVSGDDVRACPLGQCRLRLHQQWPQFGEQRDQPAFLPLDMLRLGARDENARPRPIDIYPPELKRLGRAAQAAVAGQGNEELPLLIRAGINNRLRHVAGDEKLPLFVPLHLRRQLAERVLAPRHAAVVGQLPQLPGAAAMPAEGILGQAALEHERPPVLGVGLAHLAHVLPLPEEIHQPLAGLLPVGDGPLLQIRVAVEESVKEWAQIGVAAGARLHQPRGRDPLMEHVIEPRQPCRGLRFRLAPQFAGRQELFDAGGEALRLLHRFPAKPDGRALVAQHKENPLSAVGV